MVQNYLGLCQMWEAGGINEKPQKGQASEELSKNLFVQGEVIWNSFLPKAAREKKQSSK